MVQPVHPDGQGVDPSLPTTQITSATKAPKGKQAPLASGTNSNSSPRDRGGKRNKPPLSASTTSFPTSGDVAAIDESYDYEQLASQAVNWRARGPAKPNGKGKAAPPKQNARGGGGGEAAPAQQSRRYMGSFEQGTGALREQLSGDRRVTSSQPGVSGGIIDVINNFLPDTSTRAAKNRSGHEDGKRGARRSRDSSPPAPMAPFTGRDDERVSGKTAQRTPGKPIEPVNGRSDAGSWRDSSAQDRTPKSARQSQTLYELTSDKKNRTPALQKREYAQDSPSSTGRRLWKDKVNSRSPSAPFYQEFLSLANVTKQIEEGTLVTGALRINKRNRNEAYVTCEGLANGADIFIRGVKHRNRALEGDVVVVQVLEGSERQREVDGQSRHQESRRLDNAQRQAKCDVVEDGAEETEGTVFDDTNESSVEPDDIRRYGKVVFILERKPDRYFAGTLGFDKPDGGGRDRVVTLGRDRAPRIIWFKPTDKRGPLIAIPVENAPKDFLQDPSAFSTILFKATVRNWPAASQYPDGIVTGTLGQMGEISIESAALLVDAGVLWDDFSEAVLDCLPADGWTIPAEEYTKRRDFREERIFSIDPPTARDLDDAVSVKDLGNGEYEIGVHIADVAFFVTPGTALDEEARRRATTVYLVQKVVPMLPRSLCENLCSLNPGVERLAFSVTWKFDKRARVIGQPWFGRSIIRSCAKLSYDHAQRLIEGKDWEGLPKVEITGNVTEDDIKEDTKRLYEFSRMMRDRRFEDGALSMQNVKLWFGIDDFGNPSRMGVYQIKDSNKLIEEYMLMANMAVAQKIAARFPEGAMLRNHAPPKEKGMTEFVEFAAKLGYVIDDTSSSTLQTSFESITDLHKRSVLRQLCIKPMMRARYFCTGELGIDEWSHFALNVPLYTHFTSPIRRYCDLMVHRMLEAVCDETPGDLYTKDEVSKVSKICNDRKDGSKDAQEASQKLYLCAYLTRLCEQEKARHVEQNLPVGDFREGVFARAEVYNVGPRSFDVLIPDFGIEKRVWIEDNIESGEAVGVETIEGVVTSLRVHWKKAKDANTVVDDITDATASLNLDETNPVPAVVESEDPKANQRRDRDRKDAPPSSTPSKRRYNAAGVHTQTIRIFDEVMVRIVPEIAKSPPEFKVMAEHPLGVQVPTSCVLDAARQLVKDEVDTGVSCPAAREDAE
ncbi:hypothetical protein HKX48_004403 [Thoreauomyces humboldtii]|nr:hypothetical protein HKX48_004403 [Thoreauomyces humboldtii]